MINRRMLRKLKRIVDTPWTMDVFINDVRMESRIMEEQILLVLGNEGIINKTFCVRPTHYVRTKKDTDEVEFVSVMELGVITGRHTMIKIGTVTRVVGDVITFMTNEGDTVEMNLIGGINENRI
jgi:hypothetical protein